MSIFAPKFDRLDPQIYIEGGGIHYWEIQYGGSIGQPTAGAPLERAAKRATGAMNGAFNDQFTLCLNR
jgi:hypothetical protein